MQIINPPPVIQPIKARIQITAPRKGRAAESLTKEGEEFIAEAFLTAFAERGINMPDATTIGIEREETDAGFILFLTAEFTPEPTPSPADRT